MKDADENIGNRSKAKVPAPAELSTPVAFSATDLWPDQHRVPQAGVSAAPDRKNELSLAAAERQIAAFFALK